MFPMIAVVRIVAGIAAALGTLRLGTGLYAWRVTEALERPTYTVVERLSQGVEVRRYEPYLIAETTILANREGAFEKSTATGFRACAAYIFGKNRSRKRPSGAGWWASTTTVEPEKMAMTAPVRAVGGPKATKVSFVLGTEYSRRTAPRPLDPSVQVRQVPAHTLAVRTFAGPPPKDVRITKERTILEQALAQTGRKAISDTTLVYGYHDPFITPNFLRRNEVAVVLDGSV